MYRHIRLDKNEPFYIGIGTKPINYELIPTYHKTIYHRAYTKTKSRSIHWKNIINKTNYIVQIIYESDCIIEIQEKEIEFISLYNSSLCNLTSGGHGITSFKHSKEAKLKIRNANIGKKRSKETIIKCNARKYKAITMYNDTFEKDFSSIAECLLYLNLKPNNTSITRCLHGKRDNAHGYKYKFQTVESKDKEL